MRKRTIPGKHIDASHVVDQLCEKWGPLSDAQRQLIADHLILRTYDSKEIIYQNGDVPSTLFICVEGIGYITRETKKRQRILSLIGPGDLFGFPAHFASGVYYSTAYCRRYSSLIATLPYEVLDRLLSESATTSLYFAKHLASLLAVSDIREEMLTQKHMRGRLAHTLLYLHWKFGCEADGMTLRIRPTRSEIGDLSNMTTSNVIRTLSQFAKEGLIVTEGKHILIPAPEKLERLSEDEE